MMLVQRSLARRATSVTRVPQTSSVRSFRQSAPRRYTKNEEAEGINGIIQADNSKTMMKMYHYTSRGLLALTPVAFVLSPSPLAMPVDLAVGIMLPLHAHVGMNQVISDYVPHNMRTLARLGWLGVTGVMFFGLLRVNFEGPGITEAVKTIWREPPKEQQ